MFIEIPVSAELMARAKKLAEARGTSAEEELRFAVLIGLEEHMRRNLDVIERWEARKKPEKPARWHTLQETKLTKTVECIRCNNYFRFKKKTELNIDTLPHCPACGAKMEVGK